jgi:hypothetical protein
LKKLHKIPPHLPLLAAQALAQRAKGRRDTSPFEKWFDKLTILSQPKEGD